ncbi:hypothetical protein, partial [Mycolicibacterium insubricum]|uniref:hypothetical protein n=1 Tax=Mycolicibacterium insubricum TaxID=444597 RepID=UPI0021F326A2
MAVAAVWALSPADWVALNYLDSHFAAYVPFWDDVADLAPGAVNRAFLRRVLVLSVLGATVGARAAVAGRRAHRRHADRRGDRAGRHSAGRRCHRPGDACSPPPYCPPTPGFRRRGSGRYWPRWR